VVTWARTWTGGCIGNILKGRGLNAVEQDVAFKLEQNLWKQIREGQE
jgi:hypothetical protein